jgi:hypothetical protein
MLIADAGASSPVPPAPAIGIGQNIGDLYLLQIQQTLVSLLGSNEGDWPLKHREGSFVTGAPITGAFQAPSCGGADRSRSQPARPPA